VGIQKRDHERIAALDPDRVSGEKLRHPVRHDLLQLDTGYGLVFSFLMVGSGKRPSGFRPATHCCQDQSQDRPCGSRCDPRLKLRPQSGSERFSPRAKKKNELILVSRVISRVKSLPSFPRVKSLPLTLTRLPTFFPSARPNLQSTVYFSSQPPAPSAHDRVTV